MVSSGRHRATCKANNPDYRNYRSTCSAAGLNVRPNYHHRPVAIFESVSVVIHHLVQVDRSGYTQASGTISQSMKPGSCTDRSPPSDALAMLFDTREGTRRAAKFTFSDEQTDTPL